MKCLQIILTILMVSGSNRLRAETPVLILPFSFENGLEARWEGLTMVLALQSMYAGKDHFIPFTAVRKKLNDYGLSVISRLSLATMVKLAQDLNAGLLVYGVVERGHTRIIVYNLVNHSLESFALPDPVAVDSGHLLKTVTETLGWQVNPSSNRQIEFFRIWASTYFSAELDIAKLIMNRLAAHELAGWLFLQEYLDLFGDPLPRLTTAGELVFWRDFFFQKAYFARARDVSLKLMASRHDPNDFIEHARILIQLGNAEEGCRFLEKAATFGFGAHSDLKAACENQPSQPFRDGHIR